MRKNLVGILLLLIPVISFCQKDLKQRNDEAKSLTAIKDKAIVYVVRPSFIDPILKLSTYCDSVKIGGIGAKRFLYTVLNPGTHTFMSKLDNTETLNLQLEANKIYYIKFALKIGLGLGRVSLKVVETEEGLKDLNKCKLSEDNVYDK